MLLTILRINAAAEVAEDAARTRRTDYLGRVNVCERSGVKLRPDQLVIDFYGRKVRRKSADGPHPSDLFRARRAERLTGPIIPEPKTDRFITTAVLASEL